MKSFKGHLREEELIIEGKKLATDFEAFITVAYNGGLKNDSHTLGSAKISSNEYKKNEAAAKEIAKKLHGSFGGSKMVHHGSGTGEMSDWWKGKNTPKTDCYIGKNRISLKEAGGSQIMSGGQDEALSTFTAAVKYMESDASQAQNLVDMVKSTFTEVVVPKDKMTIGDFTKAYKSEKNFKGAMKVLADKYRDTTLAHKELTKEVTSFFADNKEFRTWFTYEAATGEKKFAPDPVADANWVLKFDTSGKVHELKKLSTGVSKPSGYIKKLSGKIKYRISWKTPTSKGQKTYSSFRGDILQENITISSMINEEINSFESELLAEGLLDKGKDFVKGIYLKAKEFFKNLAKKILTYLQDLVSRGIGAILNFLELEPSSIQVSNLKF